MTMPSDRDSECNHREWNEQQCRWDYCDRHTLENGYCLRHQPKDDDESERAK